MEEDSILLNGEQNIGCCNVKDTIMFSINQNHGMAKIWIITLMMKEKP